MGRVINTESSGKERNRLSKAVVAAIRELMKQEEPDKGSLDLAAFIVLALNSISNSIDATVTPWERRGYWVKADRFRRKWAWAESLGEEMRRAVLEEDWDLVALAAITIGGKLNHVKISDRHRMGTPWVGAWDELLAQTRKTT